MAEIPYTEERVGRVQGEVVIYTWPNLTAGDTGQPVLMEHMSERSVMAFGDFSGGGSVALKGTLETTATTWVTLTNPGGTPLSFTAAGLETVLQLPYAVRPEAVAGAAARTVKLLMKKTIR